MKSFYLTLPRAPKRLAGVALTLVLAVSYVSALPEGSTTSAYSSAWADDQAHPSLKAFGSWATRFSAAPTPTVKAQMVSEGIALAQARRATLAKLIQVDPQKAISFAVPASVRDQLPADISGQLGTRISAIGDFSVMAALQAKGGPPVAPIHRFVRVNGQTYTAYVYGRRASEVSKQGIPIHGIAIDGVIALSDTALRELEPGETVSS